MEITNNKVEIPLIKRSTTYKIIIPAKVEKLIRFLCERVWDTEWSGVLFYTPTGNFEDGSLEIRCEDIFPMDIGSTTYTEFTMSPDVISYMAQNPELLDCKMGLIHSHNNMSTFFSGTDTNTLREEGADRNHFVSLIVNNAGKYTAAITRRVKFKSTRDLSYEGFTGTVNLSEKEVIEGEEIEYFYLDVEFEEEVENPYAEVAERLKEIKASKAKTTYSSNTSNTISGYPSYSGWGAASTSYSSNSKWATPTLFDDLDEPKFKGNSVTKYNLTHDYTTNKQDIPTSVDPADLSGVTDDLIEGIVNQLLSGSITAVKLEENLKKKLIETISARFDKRFGKGEEGLQLFSFWATDLVEFLLWYSVASTAANDDEVAAEIAEKTVEALKKLPKNKYIDEYIDIFMTYADRI